MQLIETKVLGTAAASIEFTSIPQDGTDLVALVNVRSDNTNVSYSNQEILLNGSSSSFSSRRLFGGGSGSPFSGTATNIAGLIPSNAATSNTFSNVLIYIPNYTVAVNKSYSVDAVMENNATESYQELIAGLWSNTAAITSLTIRPEASRNFMSGSTISLYKITKGSSGGVVVS